MLTIALAGAGAEGLRAAIPTAVHDLLDLRFVVPQGRTVAAVVNEVVDATRGERALLFGHSMNGTLALAAAATAGPGVVAGVIAVGSPPSLPPDAAAARAHWFEHAEPERRRRFDEHSKRAGATTDAAERQRWIDAADALRSWYDVDFDAAPIESAYERPRAETLEWVQAIFGDGPNVDWRHVVDHQPAPVLLVLGRSDFLVPHTLWDDRRAPSTFTIRRFDRSAHTPFVEEPERFVDELRAWLAATASPP